jgi:hypothetical protein
MMTRLQSMHSHADRGLDMYPTPPEATLSLLGLETLPRVIWEPAAGDGAIVRILQAAGHTVHASDIADYGAGYAQADYLASAPPAAVEAIVTNPPFKLALEFTQKALGEVPYLALLLRTNFLESIERLPFFLAHPPARAWVSSRRLPMMHRRDWDGPRASSNHCFAWFIWDARAERHCVLGWFDWRELCTAQAAGTVQPAPTSQRERVAPAAPGVW